MSAEWVRAIRDNVSELGADVADVLGKAYRGLYHIERAALHQRVDWSDKHRVEIVIGRELSNVDGRELTDILVGCSTRGIRVAIYGAAPGYLRLTFTRGDHFWFGRLYPLNENTLRPTTGGPDDGQ